MRSVRCWTHSGPQGVSHDPPSIVGDTSPGSRNTWSICSISARFVMPCSSRCTCSGISILGTLPGESLATGRLRDLIDSLPTSIAGGSRKDAAAINREFLDWLSDRRDRGRPYFAFLNYYDAHTPYLPPEGTSFRFGPGPKTVVDFFILGSAGTRSTRSGSTRSIHRPDPGLLRELPGISTGGSAGCSSHWNGAASSIGPW